jgi:hypothetical protein
MNYGNSFAFKDFILAEEKYEFSDIDMTEKRRIPMDKDYFTLMQFSAKWDPIQVCCQNHTQLVKGFMGQTTFDSALIKSNVLIMGVNLMGSTIYSWPKGEGMFTFTEGMIGRLSASGWKRQRSWIYPNLPATD